MNTTEAIKRFLKPPGEGGIYSDSKLVDLHVHTKAGRTSYTSCCCFAGIPTAIHELQGARIGSYSIMEGLERGHVNTPFPDARWVDASNAFRDLGATDEERRDRLSPLIEMEMVRRESLRCRTEEVSEMVMV